MCGIHGCTFRYSDKCLNKKLSSMNFRGPDFQSFKCYRLQKEKELTLGHARLSILDLDIRSNQPFDYNENISIVFNGEVYNFEELKRTYLQGVPLRTTSDTEVICALYDKFGQKCVELLNGMFAFVILNKAKCELFGARDRLGKKPFYYRWNSDGFEFASQAEPILIGNTFNIDEQARAFYLFDGYIPDPYCIWKELKKLRAGQKFVYNIVSNELEISTYWDLFYNSCGFQRPESYNEAKETVYDLLNDAVKIRLRADVPIGMFLSGGIDSSLTSALVAKHNHNITAYSIGFDNATYDESSHAKAVADALGVDIKIRKCEGKEMLDAFNGFHTFYDEPFADYSAIPSSLLAKVTRRDVTVAIGGDGGDEIFYGYSTYTKLAEKERLYKYLPYAVRKGLYSVAHLVCDSHYVDLFKFKDLRDQFICRGGYGDFKDAAKFDPYTLAHELPDIGYINDARGLLSFSDYDMKHYMNSCINTKTDRATMRYSLELRSPLMDYRLAEYSRLLPLDYLFDKQTGGKKILKGILYDMIPREILERPKHGFAAPVGEWFKSSLREQFVDTINKSDIIKYCPELDADKLIYYRDNFLRSEKDTLFETSFFKLFIYLQWIKLHSK
ncbi:MAG: asparagine synthase (glutamine-hydrolyzing) [Candidatus Aphodosoma sp.]